MLCHGFQLYWWGKPEYPEKTTDLPQATDKITNLPQATDKLDQIELHRVYFPMSRHLLHR